MVATANLSKFTQHLASWGYPASCLQHVWNPGARPTSPGNAPASASTPLGDSSSESMGQWAREVGTVGGTLVLVGGTFPLQAGTINICKAYANHPGERHNIQGMSEETLEMIQPTPPHFTGEERGPHQTGTCSRSLGHLGVEEEWERGPFTRSLVLFPRWSCLLYGKWTRWQRGHRAWMGLQEGLPETGGEGRDGGPPSPAPIWKWCGGERESGQGGSGARDCG